MTKLVYIVRSNHDGILGVFTNKKLAYNDALDYLKDTSSTIEKSYSQVCAEFKNTYRKDIEVVYNNSLILEIEQLPLNNKY